MKRISVLVFLLVFLIFPLESKALSVSQNDVYVEKGTEKYIDLYVNVEQEISSLSFNMTFSTYDIPASITFEPGITNTVSGVSYNLSFSEPIVGKVKIGSVKVKVVNNPTVTKGSVNITYPKAYTLNGDKILLNYQDININIGSSNEVIDQPITQEKIKLLERINSNIVNIDLQENVYEYEVNIKEDVAELDLSPVLTNNSYSVEVSNQKISELNDNTIIIKATDGTNTEEYKIKVKVSKEEVNNKKEETTKQENKKSTSTFKYKGKWVMLIISLLGVLFIGVVINNKSKKY